MWIVVDLQKADARPLFPAPASVHALSDPVVRDAMLPDVDQRGVDELAMLEAQPDVVVCVKCAEQTGR